MRGIVIKDITDMQRLVPAWDQLATACSRPYAAPGWQLAWWHAAASARSRPLMLCAYEDTALVGAMALYEQRTRTGLRRLRVMGAPLAQGTGPLAVPGSGSQVATVLAVALAELDAPPPATLEFEGVLEARRWAAMLCEGWPLPGRPRLLVDRRVQAPMVVLEGGTLEAWLQTRSANFRQQIRRSRRRLDSLGARFRRLEATDEICLILPKLLELHHDRWRERGGSKAVDERTIGVLQEAARFLGHDGRMHVEAIELDGRTISAHLFLTAGVESTYWLGGFDEAYAAERPGLLALVAAVGHALELGLTRLDLGPGMHPYKLRFADTSRELDWLRLLLPGPRRPLTRLQLMPRHVARTLRDGTVSPHAEDLRQGRWWARRD